MSVSLDKLRALKRQAGGVIAAATAPAPALASVSALRAVTMKGEDRITASDDDSAGNAPALVSANPLPGGGSLQSISGLRRLLGLREKALAMPTTRKSLDREVPGEEIAPGLRYIQVMLPLPAPSSDLSLAFAKRFDESVPPRDLLFFDTETTGLAGGTGTRAFMIGAADWHLDSIHGDCLRVRQLLMTTMAAEAAMLDTFSSWLSPGTVLSSYNGRCYDAPLLKTRYRLARKLEPLGALDHVDLLFPTRRRYRGTWENCRLATIERELLRIVREDDLPGSEAPAAWLNYLRGGSARNLRRVAAHNHQDVVTLALLMMRLVEVEQRDRDVLVAGPA